MTAEHVLFLAAVESDGFLSKTSLEALAVAKTVADSMSGSTLTAGLIGEKTGAAADQIASCGAKRFVTVSGSDYREPRYASDAFALEAVARAVKPTIIVAGGTSRMNRTLPGVTFRLEGRIDTHVTEVVTENGTLAVKRWFYRQRMEGVAQRAPRPWVIVTDPGCTKPWSGSSGSATVDALKAELPSGGKKTSVKGFRAPAGGEQTIRPDADVLFVAGAGWLKKQSDGQVHAPQARECILGFLSKAKASLGGSKSMVDMDNELREVFNFMTHLNQVGQTGATPRHPKGLATCCHGEEPHVVGWRFINERRAINLDANCGWARGKADVLYVADAFKVMEKVNALLGK